jgi:ATP-dependent protease ClpP protease subunit
MAAGDLNPQDLDGHIYQRLLSERIVFLGSEVRDQNANAICAQMLLLNAEDDKADIFLYINSPGGSASDIKIQAEQSLLLKKQLNELQALHTGQTIEQIEIDSDRDRWFTPAQAKEYGFIDHVVLSAGDVK